jgi:diguanylate cyclase (GGDEF)-like protein
MQPPQPFVALLLTLAGLIGLATAALVWSRRAAAPAAAPLLVLLGAMAWWDLTYAIHWSGAPNPRPHFWVDLTYCGVVTAPAALFVFAWRSALPERPLSRRRLLALTLEPLAVVLLLFTDPAHGLFFAGQRGPDVAVILATGPVYWINVMYSYLLILAGTLLLLDAFRRAQGLFRRQLGVALIGITITWINSLIMVAGLNPLPNLDNIPFSFTLNALIFAFALLRFRMLDVTPIARHVLIEGMSDGVMVLDAAGRIVDLNPAARRSLDFLAATPLGEAAAERFAALPELAAHFAAAATLQLEISVPPVGRTLEFQITPLFRSGPQEPRRPRTRLGALVTWRDVSARKQLEAELLLQATTDPLTGIANRREVLLQGARQLSRAVVAGECLALLLLDLDRFKDINDQHGHAVGDLALRAFVAVVHGQLRGGDILGRLGGDEFVILLPLTGVEAAQRVAERLLETFADPVLLPASPGRASTSLRLSASMGLACAVPPHALDFDALLARADAALYAAKARGGGLISA